MKKFAGLLSAGRAAHIAGMITRRQAALLAPAAILGTGLAGALAYVALQPEAAVPIGGPFALLDGAGRVVTEQQFRGRWMLVYFGYTHCPDACPTALQDMANALDLLGPRKKNVAIVFITVDPERDTPAAMQEYASRFEAEITALSGDAEAVARAARAYRCTMPNTRSRTGGTTWTTAASSILWTRRGGLPRTSRMRRRRSRSRPS